tara:strand:+ start:151 stop:375 length:225 start_codon:yes stop_codon:yes gene_type:complete
MPKQISESNAIQNFTRLMPSIFGLDEYDVDFSKENSNYSWKKDLAYGIGTLVIIVYGAAYLSLNSSTLTVDELL